MSSKASNLDLNAKVRFLVLQFSNHLHLSKIASKTGFTNVFRSFPFTLAVNSRLPFDPYSFDGHLLRIWLFAALSKVHLNYFRDDFRILSLWAFCLGLWTGCGFFSGSWKTNNAVEGWHRASKKIVGCVHPTICASLSISSAENRVMHKTEPLENVKKNPANTDQPREQQDAERTWRTQP